KNKIWLLMGEYFVMSKRSYSAEEKYETLKTLENHYSLNEMESIYKVHHSTILEWKHKCSLSNYRGV
ncbi:hypothetical protein, partial [Caldalkalibacillus mannanilyticus]|uniref:hypothetical protein n=1 Tax=Caldalkalibacillus mannanilyticus TaxID=1418 RepID=UPI00046904CE